MKTSFLTCRLIYFETLDPTQVQVATGTATLTVKGIADDPIITVQDEASFPQNPNLIDPIFRPDEVVDGVENSDRIYGYAGFDTAPFLLDKRLSIFTIDTGIISQNEAITIQPECYANNRGNDRNSCPPRVRQRGLRRVRDDLLHYYRCGPCDCLYQRNADPTGAGRAISLPRLSCRI